MSRSLIIVVVLILMSLPLVQYCDAVALLSHRVFYVYEGDSQTASDIIFRVLAPDGREIRPRTKVSGGLAWSFIAGQSGR